MKTVLDIATKYRHPILNTLAKFYQNRPKITILKVSVYQQFFSYPLHLQKNNARHHCVSTFQCPRQSWWIFNFEKRRKKSFRIPGFYFMKSASVLKRLLSPVRTKIKREPLLSSRIRNKVEKTREIMACQILRFDEVFQKKWFAHSHDMFSRKTNSELSRIF